jgi:hypothetical protein
VKGISGVAHRPRGDWMLDGFQPETLYGERLFFLWACRCLVKTAM